MAYELDLSLPIGGEGDYSEADKDFVELGHSSMEDKGTIS